MSGGFFLLHHVDSQRPQAFKALEIIGPQVADDSYPIAGFDSNGGTYRSTRALDGRVFRTNALHKRSSGEFSHDGQALSAKWERSPDGQVWQLWMDTTLTKIPRHEQLEGADHAR